MDHADPVLSLHAVHKSHGHAPNTVAALRGVSLEISAGSWCAIMGPSGCGKTTLLHCCAGLSQPQSGQIRVFGNDLLAMSDQQRSALRRQRLGVIFQAYNLVPTLNALDNVALPLILDGGAERPARDKAGALLERVGLSNRAQHLPAQLSGGEQQRVAIARALVADAPLVVADEPTGSLDRRSGEAVGRILREVAGGGQRTVMVVTHDPQVAAWADRVLIMVDGQVVDDCPSTGDAAAIAARVQHFGADVTAETAP